MTSVFLFRFLTPPTPISVSKCRLCIKSPPMLAKVSTSHCKKLMSANTIILSDPPPNPVTNVSMARPTTPPPSHAGVIYDITLKVFPTENKEEIFLKVITAELLRVGFLQNILLQLMVLWF